MKKLLALIIFGIAFAFVEAAVVFYLRRSFSLIGGFPTSTYSIILNLGFIAFLSPATSIFTDNAIARTELLREAATIVMLGSLAYITGVTLKQRVGAFLIAFSTWDIFYYLFLRLLFGWPKSLLDVDVYFLIPVAWVGPIITPLVISAFLFMAGIRLFAQREVNP